ncbi:MAG TPA: methyltransferase domain-containing protein [Steroidobacteraceae bacterium]|jgi:SAM-dependent methyltransferase
MNDRSQALLGDAPSRDYAEKLKLFNAFAAPELKRLIAALGLHEGAAVLDAGCGTGEALGWLHAAVQPGGTVLGIDLSVPHVEAARQALVSGIAVCQGDLATPPVKASSLDLIWSCNAINHVRDPVQVLERWKGLLHTGGRVALGQSSLLPDMYFAWDARLERLTNEAIRQYYRERYNLTEVSLSATRGLVGLLRRAGFSRVTPATIVIERVTPLDSATERYLQRAIFEGTFRDKLRAHLDEADYRQLSRLMDPAHPEYALHRGDFHFIQTFTLVTGET